MLADVAVDRFDQELGQLLAILGSFEFVSVEVEEIVCGGEGASLVASQERMVASDAKQKGNDISFVVMLKISDKGERAF